jgi:hypothetical protein
MRNNKSVMVITTNPLSAIEKAKKDNLWFSSIFKCEWYSPKQFEKKIKKGQIKWNFHNWVLRPIKKQGILK